MMEKYPCQDCIGMSQHGCYCQAMGALWPGCAFDPQFTNEVMFCALPYGSTFVYKGEAWIKTSGLRRNNAVKWHYREVMGFISASTRVLHYDLAAEMAHYGNPSA